MPASVDRDIKLGVSINTSSVKQDADKLAKSIQGVFSHYSRDSKSANANLMSLQHQMAKYSNDLNLAIEKANKLSQQKTPTQEYLNTEKALNQANAQAEKLAVTLQTIKDKAKTEGKDVIDIKGFSELENKYNRVKESAEKYEATLNRLKTSGAGYTQTDTPKYTKAINDVTRLQNKLAELKVRYDQTANSSRKSGKTLVDSFKNAFKHLGNLYSKLKQLKNHSTGTFGDMAKSAKISFTKILKYAFGIRSIYALFRRLRTYTKEAFDAMSQSIPRVRDDLNSLSSSFGQVKNSLGTAFQPILSYAVPALNALAGALVTAMNALANFFATFTGQKVIYKATKANNNLAKSYGGAGGSAKDAAEDIAEYDKLIVINQDKASGGGGGGGSADTGAGLFEEVPAEASKLAQMIKDAWKDADFTDVGNYIGQKLVDAMEGINWDKYKKTGKKIGKSVATFLNGVFETPNLFSDVGITIAEALNTVVGTLGSFSSNFHWNSLGKGMADGVNSFFRTFDFPQLAQTIHDTIVGVLTTVGTFFRETDFKEIGTKLGQFINDLDIPDILSTLGQTIHDAIIGALDLAISFFKQTDFQEIGKSIGSFLNKLDIVDLALKLGELALNILKALADAMIGLMKENPLAGAIVSLLVGIKVAGKLGALSNGILGEIGTFSETAKATLATNFSNLFSTTGAIFLGISTAIAGWNLGQYIYESAKKDKNGDNWIDRLVEDILGDHKKSLKDRLMENWGATESGHNTAADMAYDVISGLFGSPEEKAEKKAQKQREQNQNRLDLIEASEQGSLTGLTKVNKNTKTLTNTFNKLFDPLTKATLKFNLLGVNLKEANKEFKGTPKYALEAGSGLTVINKSADELGNTISNTSDKVGIATTGMSGQFKNARYDILGSVQLINSDVTSNLNTTQQNGSSSVNTLKNNIINALGLAKTDGTRDISTLSKDSIRDIKSIQTDTDNPLTTFKNNIVSRFASAYSSGNSDISNLKTNAIANLTSMKDDSESPLSGFASKVSTWMSSSLSNVTGQNNNWKIAGSNLVSNLNTGVGDSFSDHTGGFKWALGVHMINSLSKITEQNNNWKNAGGGLTSSLNTGVGGAFSNNTGGFLWALGIYMANSLNKINEEHKPWQQSGNFLVQGLMGGITSLWKRDDNNGLFGRILNLARNLTAKLNAGFGVASPSKEWAKTGRWLDLGLIEGIESKEQKVINSISSMGIRMSGTLQDSLSDDIQLPDIVQGKVIPTAMSYNIQTTNTQENIRDIIREELSNLNLSMPERIAVEMPDSRVLAEVVWDEEEKRYKQYGYT